jgi:hypothetical protein
MRTFSATLGKGEEEEEDIVVASSSSLLAPWRKAAEVSAMVRREGLV